MKYVMILGALALAVVGFAAFALFGSGPTEPAVTSTGSAPAEVQPSDATADQPLTGRGSLNDLMALSADLECELRYQPSDQSASVDGTYFVSNGQMRADFLVWSAELGNQVSSMIVRSDTTYVWSEIDGETYGMSFETALLQEGENEVADSAVVSMDDEVEYTCRAWRNVDPSVFLPPSDVRFQDYSDLMQQGMQYGTIYEEGQPMPDAMEFMPN
jgi:hypothetical protein